jgi:membrane protease YdiL (CAAX protease family)
MRLLPFSLAVAGTWALRRPRWLGLSVGERPGMQLTLGVAGGVLSFAAAAAIRLRLSRDRGVAVVPAGRADAVLQGAYYLLNAPVEEAFFRGLLQGGVGARWGGSAGLVAGLVPYVLYHRLGRWPWPEVLATSLIGVPAAAAYRWLPGRPSLLAITLAHAGATCGFLGPGPWVLRKLRLL